MVEQRTLNSSVLVRVQVPQLDMSATDVVALFYFHTKIRSLIEMWLANLKTGLQDGRV